MERTSENRGCTLVSVVSGTLQDQQVQWEEVKGKFMLNTGIHFMVMSSIKLWSNPPRGSVGGFIISGVLKRGKSRNWLLGELVWEVG